MAQTLSSGYIVGERLGAGRLGTVYRSATSGDGPDQAVKLLCAEFALDPKIRADFAAARALMTALRSPHLVSVENVVLGESEIAIVMELVSGGNLRNYFDLHGAQTEFTAVHAIHQVLRGLATIHGHDAAHGDVRPENVLLASTPGAPGMTAKLSDFGIASLVSKSATTPAADVRACAAMLYEFVAGEAPEESAVRPEAMSDALWLLVIRWLAPDPVARPADAWEALAELDALLDTGRNAWPDFGGDEAMAIGDGFGFTLPARSRELPDLPAPLELVSATPVSGSAPGAIVLFGDERRTAAPALASSPVIVLTAAAVAPARAEILDVIDIIDSDNAVLTWPGPVLGFDLLSAQRIRTGGAAGRAGLLSARSG